MAFSLFPLYPAPKVERSQSGSFEVGKSAEVESSQAVFPTAAVSASIGIGDMWWCCHTAITEKCFAALLRAMHHLYEMILGCSYPECLMDAGRMMVLKRQAEIASMKRAKE